MRLPEGFGAYVANIGIKDSSTDFTLVVARTQCAASGVFTQSRFAGPSVLLSREHVGKLAARAVVVISKNANVATGAEGMRNAREIVSGVAKKIGCAEDEVLIASTGVIGRQYPMEKVRAGLAAIPATIDETSVVDVARAIMTTDTRHKTAESTIAGSTARVVGVAKGIKMIEPNMATLITLMFTDAMVDKKDLDNIFRRVIDKTFNCVSIDADTSTSDTAIVLASGKSGAVDLDAFESALYQVALSLTQQVARDGEGAEKLIEVCVDSARDERQAKLVAKAIVNSPLIKTAVHGANPNWGRVAMAVGKCSTETDIDANKVVIRFGSQEVYPGQVDEQGLDALSKYMRSDTVRIHVSLQTGSASSTVWGCDLTDGYVRINAEYTR
ncbi:MAG: bifunctional glutamate N-acetyltransferase/amino-acid acetyltransferase ArgJ [Actinobacteria bacterium]|nr:bifunctional glutamate N-acetyltransferase/amino-acid acetyltransferase ArgJ [Actinomycetota bacterium]